MGSGEEGWAGGRGGGEKTLEKDQASALDDRTVYINVRQRIFRGAAEETFEDVRDSQIVLVAHATRGG